MNTNFFTELAKLMRADLDIVMTLSLMEENLIYLTLSIEGTGTTVKVSTEATPEELDALFIKAFLKTNLSTKQTVDSLTEFNKLFTEAKLLPIEKPKYIQYSGRGKRTATIVKDMSVEPPITPAQVEAVKDLLDAKPPVEKPKAAPKNEERYKAEVAGEIVEGAKKSSFEPVEVNHPVTPPAPEIANQPVTISQIQSTTIESQVKDVLHKEHEESGQFPPVGALMDGPPVDLLENVEIEHEQRQSEGENTGTLQEFAAQHSEPLQQPTFTYEDYTSPDDERLED